MFIPTHLKALEVELEALEEQIFKGSFSVQVLQSWANTSVQLVGGLIYYAEIQRDGQVVEHASALMRDKISMLSNMDLTNALSAPIVGAFWGTLGNALSYLGSLRGSAIHLQGAVDAYDAALKVRSKEGMPMDWAGTQNNLGYALQSLGGLIGSVSLLERAVEASCAALQIRTKDTTPEEWAGTQNNLGNALLFIGRLQGAAEPFERAIAAFEASLDVRTKKKLPTDWAGTQNNLGNALESLGDLIGSATLLKSAAKACRAALEVYTKDNSPTGWATAKINLGNALLSLGGLQGNPDQLERAVEAYQAALGVYTRNSSGSDWAMTQNNLGNALLALGNLRGNEAKLKRSLNAYRAALEVYTKDSSPTDWARTRHNFSNALSSLGRLCGSATYLKRSIEAYNSVLEIRTKELMPADWAGTQSNMGYALSSLGQLQGNTANLDGAIKAFNSALSVQTREGMPASWAGTQHNLGNALRSLGTMRDSAEQLEHAIKAHEAALEVRTKEGLPADWAISQNDLGNALQSLGDLQGNARLLERALDAYTAALEVYSKKDTPNGWAMTQNNLGGALQSLGSFQNEFERFLAAGCAYGRSLEFFELGNTAANWSSSLKSLSSLLERHPSLPWPEDLLTSTKTSAIDGLSVISGSTEPKVYLQALWSALALGADWSDLGADVADVAVTRMNAGLQQAGSLDARKSFLQDVQGLGDRLAAAAIEAGELDLVPRLLSLTRARELSRRIEITEHRMTEGEREQLTALRDEVRSLHSQAQKLREQSKLDRARDLEEQAKVPAVAIEALFTDVEARRGDGRDAAPDTTEALCRDLQDAGFTGLLTLIPSRRGSFAVLVYGSMAVPKIVTERLPDAAPLAAGTLISDWLTTYNTAFRQDLREDAIAALQKWEAHLQENLPKLWDIAGCAIEQLITRAGLTSDCKVALLLPGSAALLPWESSMSPEGIFLRAKTRLCRIPSSDVLRTLAKRRDEPQRQGNKLLSVTDPQGDLRSRQGITSNPAQGAFSEDSTVALAQETASLDAVRKALPTANIVSFFLHGTWGGQDGARSGLAMAGDELLNPESLQEGDLQSNRLVVIGACEAANVAMDNPDEVDSLPTAFLTAGAPTVMATLWPVPGATTHALLTAFFQELAKCIDPDIALNATITKPQDQSGTVDGMLNIFDPAEPKADPINVRLTTTAAFVTVGM